LIGLNVARHQRRPNRTREQTVAPSALVVRGNVIDKGGYAAEYTDATTTRAACGTAGVRERS